MIPFSTGRFVATVPHHCKVYVAKKPCGGGCRRNESFEFGQ
jgi:hypothetical protein